MFDPWHLVAKCVRASFTAYNSVTLIGGRSSSEFVAPHPSKVASEYIVVSGGGAWIKWWEVDMFSVPGGEIVTFIIIIPIVGVEQQSFLIQEYDNVGPPCLTLGRAAIIMPMTGTFVSFEQAFKKSLNIYKYFSCVWFNFHNYVAFGMLPFHIFPFFLLSFKRGCTNDKYRAAHGSLHVNWKKRGRAEQRQKNSWVWAHYKPPTGFSRWSGGWGGGGGWHSQEIISVQFYLRFRAYLLPYTFLDRLIGFIKF